MRSRWRVPASRTYPSEGAEGRAILASSCAAAASAAEARFRIDRPIEENRRTAVIALDRGAEEITADAARTASSRVSFFSAGEGFTPSEEAHPPVEDGDLRTSDLVIMVATSQLDGSTAASVARLCAQSRVPIFGLVVGRPLERAAAVSALRDQTAMLLASETPSDLGDILSDLRA
jgi:hypothetical protein